MPGTYTHKFDKATFKGDVTINTGQVFFLDCILKVVELTELLR